MPLVNQNDAARPEDLSVMPSATARGHWLHHSSSRYRLYFAVAVLLLIATYAAVAAKSIKLGQQASLLVSDGSGYYAYLPSIILDHDLDFRNQVEDQFHGLGNQTGLSYLYPQWPIGVALTLVPPFLAAHVVTLALHGLTGRATFVPNGYSLLYEPICCAYILLLSFVMMVLADRILHQRFQLSGPAIALAVLTYWLGSNYLWYCFREPFMAHVISAFWVAAVVYVTHRMLRELERDRFSGWKLLLLAFCISMALITRGTNAALFPLFVYLLYAIVKAGQGKRFLQWLPVALIGAVPLLVQMGVWRILTGYLTPVSAEQMGYHNQGFTNWNHPYLWRTLFSSFHGLFFWSPLLLLSVLGIALYLIKGPPTTDRMTSESESRPRRFDPLLIALLCTALLIWYLNSSWWNWWFGAAVGGRAFLGLSILFIFGLGFCYEFASGARLFWRRMTVVAAVMGILVAWTLMLLWMAGRIPHENYLFGKLSPMPDSAPINSIR